MKAMALVAAVALGLALLLAWAPSANAQGDPCGGYYGAPAYGYGGYGYGYSYVPYRSYDYYSRPYPRYSSPYRGYRSYPRSRYSSPYGGWYGDSCR